MTIDIEHVRTLRLDYAHWTAQLREYERDLDHCQRDIRQQLLWNAQGDIKAIGPNEQARADAHERAYAADDACKAIAEGREVAQQKVAELRAEIDALEDEIRLERLRVDSERTAALLRAIEAGVSVQVVA